MQDIYFPDRGLTPRSSEHILLNALGGRLESSDLIAKPTNDVFGDTIDAALERSMAGVRMLLNAPSGDGNPPGRFPEMRMADGRRIIFGPGGKPRFVPRMGSVEREPDKTITKLVASIDPDEDIQKLFKRDISTGKMHPDMLREVLGAMAQPPIRSALPPIPLQFTFHIEQIRCIAKMACNLFALHHRDVFSRNDFDPIRGFIGDGEVSWLPSPSEAVCRSDGDGSQNRWVTVALPTVTVPHQAPPL